ncbi:unnamed protein product [Tilletia controversa]|nr:unnamed protein product [Tilletia controversa]CAD6943853.1 unnamed protein product [Tilletia controversa]
MLTMDITTSSLSSLRLKLRVPRLPALPAPGSMLQAQTLAFTRTWIALDRSPNFAVSLPSVHWLLTQGIPTPCRSMSLFASQFQPTSSTLTKPSFLVILGPQRTSTLPSAQIKFGTVSPSPRFVPARPPSP